ncbi:EexN family lipoprotein [Photobacterium leiognathi]|uniref:EexN family lipoprotein n=1 Tax=Photobacterium leiognathi TaxID=553611 RepID=UPI00273A5815|nr:EexN family lipoprotein [Photobacterium leiognathi]
MKNKMHRKFLIAAFAVTAFVGCKEDSKSVDYYANHADEAKVKVTECRKDPDAETNQNCRNAKIAFNDIRQQELHRMAIEANKKEPYYKDIRFGK